MKMKPPKDLTELRRFFGMVNQLSKFQPQIAELSKPLRDLLSWRCHWLWYVGQQQAFVVLKENLVSTPTLAHYDARRQTTLSSDASSYRLGAVLLLLQDNEEWRPVAYASRAMSPTEQRYAQIEKGCPSHAQVNASQTTLLGCSAESDRKPLVPMLSTMNLEELPARVQRFRMWMMRFSYTISHVPGWSLYTADTLSRSPIDRTLTKGDEELERAVQAFVDSTVKYLPSTEDRLEELRSQEQQDEVTKSLIDYCSQGWPDKFSLLSRFKVLWPERSELTIQQGLLMKGNRLVMPLSMRLEILDRIHEAYQGITECSERAKTSFWWPGLSKQLEELAARCPTSVKERVNPAKVSDPIRAT